MNLYLDTSLEIRENYTAYHLSRDEVTGNPTDSIFLVYGIKYFIQRRISHLFIFDQDSFD